MFEFMEAVVGVMQVLVLLEEMCVWLFGSAASGMADRRQGAATVDVGCECMRVCGLVTPVTMRRQESTGLPRREG